VTSYPDYSGAPSVTAGASYQPCDTLALPGAVAAHARGATPSKNLNARHSDAAEQAAMQTIARYRLGLVHEGEVPYGTSARCDRPESAAPFLHRILATYDREVVGGLYLNHRHDAIGHTIAYIGTLTQALVEPRGLLVPALLANATGVIVFHNHPSGAPTPSSDDIALTRRLVSAGEIVGISVLDHIVLGEAPHYASIRQVRPW